MDEEGERMGDGEAMCIDVILFSMKKRDATREFQYSTVELIYKMPFI